MVYVLCSLIDPLLIIADGTALNACEVDSQVLASRVNQSLARAEVNSEVEAQAVEKNTIETDYKIVDDLKYEQYLKDSAKGTYDIPYGMTKEEYSQYLKGIEKVNDDIAISKVDYDEILKIRNEGTDKAVNYGKYSTSIDNKVKAIDKVDVPDWKNSRQYEAVIEVPKGQILNIGRVEKQYTKTGALVEGEETKYYRHKDGQ